MLSGTLTDSSESSSSGFTTAVKCRGTLSTWRDFGEAKWKTQFPWLEIRSDGVYCHYCRTGTTRGASRSGSETFISKPYTGLRPDVLYRHQNQSVIHLESRQLYHESLERQRRRKAVNELVSQQDCRWRSLL